MGGPVMQRFDPSKLSFDDQFVNGSYSSSNPTKQIFKIPILPIGMLLQAYISAVLPEKIPGIILV